ncbi:hypothetical protein B0A49_05678 [Cryomyces minteri]|nr:hypothetical protein B0A49_05678 [Cryomyces minteri]
MINNTESSDDGPPLPKKLKVGKYSRRNSGSRKSSRSSTTKGIQSSTSHMIKPNYMNACETIDPSQPTAVNIGQPVTQLDMTAADKDEREFAASERYRKLEKELVTVRVELGRLTTRNAELDSAALLLRALAKEVVVQTAGMTGSNFGAVGEVLGRLRDAVQD